MLEMPLPRPFPLFLFPFLPGAMLCDFCILQVFTRNWKINDTGHLRYGIHISVIRNLFLVS